MGAAVGLDYPQRYIAIPMRTPMKAKQKTPPTASTNRRSREPLT
jgi:hypothetical protein